MIYSDITVDYTVAAIHQTKETDGEPSVIGGNIDKVEYIATVTAYGVSQLVCIEKPAWDELRVGDTIELMVPGSCLLEW